VGLVFGWGRDVPLAEAGGVVPPTESSAPEAEGASASLALELMVVPDVAAARSSWNPAMLERAARGRQGSSQGDERVGAVAALSCSVQLYDCEASE
jgi:hypothetical protein